MFQYFTSSAPASPKRRKAKVNQGQERSQLSNSWTIARRIMTNTRSVSYLGLGRSLNFYHGRPNIFLLTFSSEACETQASLIGISGFSSQNCSSDNTWVAEFFKHRTVKGYPVGVLIRRLRGMAG